MPVRVITNLVLFERIDHIGAAPAFQSPRFLSHDFESGPDILLCQKLSHTQRRVITRRQDVILGVKPQYDVNLGFGFLAAGEGMAYSGKPHINDHGAIEKRKCGRLLKPHGKTFSVGNLEPFITQGWLELERSRWLPADRGT